MSSDVDELATEALKLSIRARDLDAELTTTAHALTIAVERCDKLAQALEEACQILENFGFPKAAERFRGVMGEKV